MYLIFLSRNNILVKHVQKSNLKNIKYQNLLLNLFYN